MALELEELQTLRDDLVRARARGAKVVQINGERVEYRSDAEMRVAIADLDSQIAAASGTARPSRKVTPSTSTGWR